MSAVNAPWAILLNRDGHQHPITQPAFYVPSSGTSGVQVSARGQLYTCGRHHLLSGLPRRGICLNVFLTVGLFEDARQSVMRVPSRVIYGIVAGGIIAVAAGSALAKNGPNPDPNPTVPPGPPWVGQEPPIDGPPPGWGKPDCDKYHPGWPNPGHQCKASP